MSWFLCALNTIDFVVACGVVLCGAYAIWHGHHKAPLDVWVPVLILGACLAGSSALNWCTITCHLDGCSWLLNCSVILDVVVGAGAAILGILLHTQYNSVEEWIKDVEFEPNSDGSASYPFYAPEVVSHLHKGTVSVICFVLAAVQLCRAVVCMFIKRKLQILDNQEVANYPEFASSKYDFEAEGDGSSSNYRQWGTSGSLIQDHDVGMTVSGMDRVAKSISEKLAASQRKEEEAKAFQKANRARRPISYVNTSSNRRDYLRNQLMREERKPSAKAGSRWDSMMTDERGTHVGVTGSAAPPWRR